MKNPLIWKHSHIINIIDSNLHYIFCICVCVCSSGTVGPLFVRYVQWQMFTDSGKREKILNKCKRLSIDVDVQSKKCCCTRFENIKIIYFIHESTFSIEKPHWQRTIVNKSHSTPFLFCLFLNPHTHIHRSTNIHTYTGHRLLT